MLRLVTTALLVAALFGCGSGTTDEGQAAGDPTDGPAADSDECDDEALMVPTPELVADGIEAPMDLLWVEHRGCGYNADGAANLGLEPAVFSIDGRVEVKVPSAFDVRYAFSPAEVDDGSFASAMAVGADEALAVDVPESGCHLLQVELKRGDLTGRFVNRMQTSEGNCPPSEEGAP